LRNTDAIDEAAQATPPELIGIAKAMGDLDDLVRLLRKTLPRAKPWQRQVASRLTELDRLLQVLRLTIVIERSDAEILAASEALCLACRRIGTAVVGSRCDPDTKVAIHLIGDLANVVRDELRRIDSTHARLLRPAR
jgi:hypothetical protein